MESEGLGQFLSGLIIGLFLGLILGPILRSWLAWREWVDASREARLTEEVLRRMDDPHRRPSAHDPPRTSPGSPDGKAED